MNELHPHIQYISLKLRDKVWRATNFYNYVYLFIRYITQNLFLSATYEVIKVRFKVR